MKKLLFLLLVVGYHLSEAQTIYRVNSDATVSGTNVYHTVQAAHDAAASGDILIIEPGASVGDLNCTKSVTIYGRGYYLNYNATYSGLANNASNSAMGLLTINANNVNVSGLTTSGIQINGGSNITITRITSGQVYVGDTTPITNLVFSQNTVTLFGTGGVTTAGMVSNVTVSNCLIYGQLIVTSINSNVLINQNVIKLVASGGIYNSAITNNIFLDQTTVNTSNTFNSTYNFNSFPTGSTVAPPVGSNNILVNMTGLFITNTAGPDNAYRVSNGNVCKTAGNSGGEIGMFGGATPYIQYGIPAVPIIQKLVNTGLGNSTTPITATTTAISNN